MNLRQTMLKAIIDLRYPLLVVLIVFVCWMMTGCIAGGQGLQGDDGPSMAWEDYTRLTIEALNAAMTVGCVMHEDIDFLDEDKCEKAKASYEAAIAALDMFEATQNVEAKDQVLVFLMELQSLVEPVNNLVEEFSE
ncbi:MAG: hypothetical protein GY847_01610 [Proteobacteria bacterium]|nr:hypothetical protein [Pseudomonadota bacterium]